MKFEELIENEIYCIGCDKKYIFRKIGSCNEIITYLIRDLFFMKTNGSLNAEFNSGFGKNNYRLATQKEKDHFLQCDKAGRYVNYTKEKNLEFDNYQIF